MRGKRLQEAIDGGNIEDWHEKNSKIFKIIAKSTKEKFDIKNGIITNDGIYKGHPRWVPFILAVSEEYCNTMVILEPQFVKLFPELEQYKMVMVYKYDQDRKMAVQTWTDSQLKGVEV